MKGTKVLNNQSKKWSRSLRAIKPMMPRNYISVIIQELQSTDNQEIIITKNNVIDAFRDKMKNEKKLSIIFSIAYNVVEKDLAEQKNTSRKLKLLQRAAAQAV